MTIELRNKAISFSLWLGKNSVNVTACVSLRNADKPSLLFG